MMIKKIEHTSGKDYSVRELISLAISLGWEIKSKPSGTGHLIARKEGERPFDIPSNPSKKTKQKILKQMGLK